jgi:hypothetical protein
VAAPPETPPAPAAAAPAAPAPAPESTHAPTAPPVPAPAPTVEFDGEFNEGRAKSLIQNLRDEIRTLKGKSQDTEVTELRERADNLTVAVEHLTLEAVAKTHGIGEEYYDLLGSGTREELEFRAARLAALHGSAAPVEPKAPPSNRPVESLRPGASPQPPQAEDNSYPAMWQ